MVSSAAQLACRGGTANASLRRQCDDELLKLLGHCEPVSCDRAFRALALGQVREAPRCWLDRARGVRRIGAAYCAVDVRCPRLVCCVGLCQGFLLLLRVAAPALASAKPLHSRLLGNICQPSLRHKAQHSLRLPKKVHGAAPVLCSRIQTGPARRDRLRDTLGATLDRKLDQWPRRLAGRTLSNCRLGRKLGCMRSCSDWQRRRLGKQRARRKPLPLAREWHRSQHRAL